MQVQTSPTRKRKPLRERSEMTFGDMERNPDALVGPADLAAAGIVGSYSAIGRQVKDGRLPEPLRLPNGRPTWRAGTIVNVVLGEQVTEAA